jgi:ADP-L-glycero-D-manno-heptose 6-epimerase
MIIVTGGAGFIGSNLIKSLNEINLNKIYIFDRVTKLKKMNLKNLDYKKIYHKSEIFNFLNKNQKKISTIFHLGACTNTQEMNWDYLYKNNFIFTKKLIEFSAVNNIKLIYASSASIYGKDSGNINEIKDSNSFKPLNYYAKSKFILDKFVEKNIKKNIPLVGLRYFNVYGLNESHKLGMASPIHSFFNQLNSNGKCKIFGSFDGFKKGEHKRDFVSVNDCVSINIWAMKKKIKNPIILNVGTGKNHSFNFVAKEFFKYFNKGKIEYIKFPEKIKKGYQSNTKAKISSLRNLGYKKNFINLQEGIKVFFKENDS